MIKKKKKKQLDYLEHIVSGYADGNTPAGKASEGRDKLETGRKKNTCEIVTESLTKLCPEIIRKAKVVNKSGLVSYWCLR